MMEIRFAHVSMLFYFLSFFILQLLSECMHHIDYLTNEQGPQ